MRKLILLGMMISAPVLINAQYYWDYGGGIGAANYLGDIGGKELTRRDFVPDMKLQETRTTAEVFARYKISSMFSGKATFSYVGIKGDDALTTNPPRHYRNLSFTNNMFELNAMCQWFYYEVNDLGHTYRYKDNFRAYIGLGIGGVFHNPKTRYPDPTSGDWVKLRPLQTEGVKYTKVTFVIPASAGFYFTINKHQRIGWEFNWRTTFTDYLDDVSSNYADPAILNAHDPSGLAVALADRTDHAAADAFGASDPNDGYGIGFGNNFGFSTWTSSDGETHFNKRGDPTHNDSYMTTMVEYSYVFRGKSSLYRSHYSSIFKGKKYKKRKVRAKF